MRTVLIRAVLVTCVLGASGRLSGGAWAPYGPSGGSVQSLAVDPSAP